MKNIKSLISTKGFTYMFGVCLIMLATSGWATTINLAFDSLPTDQGWLYQGDVPESSVFSINGTTLKQNTLGQGNIHSIYFIPNIIDPSTPFTVSVRARILQSDAASSLPFSFVSFTGIEIFQAVLGLDKVRIQGQDFFLDNTQFHDFRFEALPGIGSSFFVDNNLLANFSPFPTSVTTNSILFGDGSAYPNSNGVAEIQRYTFTQNSTAIPEPSTMLLFFFGLAGLVGFRRKRLFKKA